MPLYHRPVRQPIERMTVGVFQFQGEWQRTLATEVVPREHAAGRLSAKRLSPASRRLSES